MSSDNDVTDGLRGALSVTPSNVPLRLLLARALMEQEQHEAAETEFKKALQLEPDNVEARMGLAEACQAQGKHSMALVVLEDLMRSPDAPAESFLAFARIASGAGQFKDAAEAYQQAIAMQPSLHNPDLERGFAGYLSNDEDLEQDSGEDDEPEFMVGGRVRQAHDDDLVEDAIAEIEAPEVTFAEVGGMESLKDEIRLKIILPMTNKELYAAYGKAIGGGILMYGPPGCGKTHLARATAGEVKASFISVGLSDVLDMWIGQSEKKLHGIFEQARRSTPCVLFFDEVDALGASRTDMRRSAGRQLINQFLSELDGLGSDNEGILVLAATNAPWHLDNAFRRPGRFDRVLFVPPPDAAARSEILRIMLADKPTDDLDIKKLAGKTEDFSGADLKALIDVTVENKLREAMQTGKILPIHTKDLLRAVKQVKCSTREWFATARNYALYSNEGGVYDDILCYLGMA